MVQNVRATLGTLSKSCYHEEVPCTLHWQKGIAASVDGHPDGRVWTAPPECAPTVFYACPAQLNAWIQVHLLCSAERLRDAGVLLAWGMHTPFMDGRSLLIP